MLGALSSPLAAWLAGSELGPRSADLHAYAEHLRNAHPAMGLTRAELLTITNWLDVNCPYHRSYWGRLNAKYADHPNYRPEVTFQEARMRTVPESIRKNEAAGRDIAPVP